MSWQSPPLGAVHLDYRGTRTLLGRTSATYAVWDAAGGEPIQTFPLTAEGWAAAWQAYRMREGTGADAQAAAWTPSPTATWERGRPLAMAPMRVGQLLDGAFKLYRMHFRTLIPLVALVVVPAQLVILVATVATLQPVLVDLGPETVTVEQPASWVTWGSAAVQVLFVTPFLTAAVVRTAADAFLGHPTGVGRAYRAALPRVHSILWVSILTAIGVGLVVAPVAVIAVALGTTGGQAGAALFVVLIVAVMVPVFFLLLRWLFATSAVVIEDVRGTRALARSWSLARGLTGKVLGTMLLAGLIVLGLILIVGIVAAIVLLPTGGQLLESGQGPGPGFYAFSAVFNTITTLVSTPFTTLVIVLLYFDARMRKEGFDLEMMAQQLGEPIGA